MKKRDIVGQILFHELRVSEGVFVYSRLTLPPVLSYFNALKPWAVDGGRKRNIRSLIGMDLDAENTVFVGKSGVKNLFIQFLFYVRIEYFFDRRHKAGWDGRSGRKGEEQKANISLCTSLISEG